MSSQSAPEQVDRLCEVMHDAYEEAAAKAGWETQERSRKPWADVPEANKATMRAAVTALLHHLMVNEGLRPPARVVSTVEELEALPLESVVIDGGRDAWQKLRAYRDGRPAWHDASGAGHILTSEALADGFYEPLSLIHEPEATP